MSLAKDMYFCIKWVLILYSGRIYFTVFIALLSGKELNRCE
ncbi:hypothetical protein LDG_8727 [Legionella drancourtii LLAP12]|uniref:Uncharacterized protein n=1 Tax=Legionella drancourtii LLAP12 TaxID=658187 RepID=G9ETU1_9GAMM|nr:hypothetical protein LDG_8727 [Legionella drancourtii LLAP12]